MNPNNRLGLKDYRAQEPTITDLLLAVWIVAIACTSGTALALLIRYALTH